MHDIEALPDIDELVQGRPLTLFQDRDISAQFLNTDVRALRYGFLSVEVSPPGTSLNALPYSEEEEERPYTCNLLLEDGNLCKASFSSHGKLIHHRVRAHGMLDMARKAVVTNQCPMCHTVFMNLEYTRRHVARAART
eukprot:12072022-Karenia_brevis.AAC.1